MRDMDVTNLYSVGKRYLRAIRLGKSTQRPEIHFTVDNYVHRLEAVAKQRREVEDQLTKNSREKVMGIRVQRHFLRRRRRHVASFYSAPAYYAPFIAVAALPAQSVGRSPPSGNACRVRLS
jgi:hypothetical protein